MNKVTRSIIKGSLSEEQELVMYDYLCMVACKPYPEDQQIVGIVDSQEISWTQLHKILYPIYRNGVYNKKEENYIKLLLELDSKNLIYHPIRGIEDKFLPKERFFKIIWLIFNWTGFIWVILFTKLLMDYFHGAHTGVILLGWILIWIGSGMLYSVWHTNLVNKYKHDIKEINP